MENTLISIIVPCYKPNLSYLNECIESVINQTSDKWELIVVYDGDDFSEYKDTETLISKFSNSKIKFYTKKHSGLSGTRNVGIKNSTGTHLCYLDCDDSLCPVFIEFSIKMINDYPSKIIAYNSTTIKNQLDTNLNREIRIRGYEASDDFFFGEKPSAFSCSTRSSCAKVYPKELIFFDEEQTCIGEDVLYVYEYSTKYKFVCANFISYFYRVNEVSITHEYKRNYLFLYLSLIEKQSEFAKKQPNKKWIIYVAKDTILSTMFALFKQIVFCKNNPNKLKDYKLVLNNECIKSNIPLLKIKEIKDKRKKAILFLFKTRMKLLAYVILKLHY